MNLRELFQNLPHEKKLQILSFVEILLERAANRAGRKIEELQAMERFPQITDVLGYRQLVGLVREARKALEKDPNHDVSGVWEKVTAFLSE